MTAAGTPRPPVALITGASRGLGAVLARFLVNQGFAVILNARGSPALEALAEELRRGGHDVESVAGDVSEGRTQKALRAAVDRLSRLDLLVNNASELGPAPLPSLVEYPPGELEGVFRVNVIAPLSLIQELLPPLRASQGRVVNISSDAALGGYPGWGGYGASKAALDLLSLTLAHELSDAGVSVVSVDPGDMRTSMHQAAYPGQDISDRPMPEVTVPFWAWLLNQPGSLVSGHRFQAQADRWEVPV